jgi:hypothetical protein
MNFKTLKYEKIEQKLATSNISLVDVEKSIRLAIYIAMVEGDHIIKKFELVESVIVEYFTLDKLLSDSEVDNIFELVVGTKEQEKELLDLTLKDIQTYYLSFVLSIKDENLKSMLIDLLDSISTVESEASTDELIIYNTYVELLNSEVSYDAYQPILTKIDEYRSNYIYARHSEHNKGFSKKLKKALSTYALGLVEDDVIALYDSTIFGGADEGFLITKLGIITTQDEDFSVIPFAMIYNLTYEKGAMRFFYKKGEAEELIEIACLPRIDNLRILVNILQHITDINIAQDKKEEVA